VGIINKVVTCNYFRYLLTIKRIKNADSYRHDEKYANMAFCMQVGRFLTLDFFRGQSKTQGKHQSGSITIGEKCLGQLEMPGSE